MIQNIQGVFIEEFDIWTGPGNMFLFFMKPGTQRFLVSCKVEPTLCS